MKYQTKRKRTRFPKLTKSEFAWYEKGYWDGSVGNRYSVLKSQVKK